MAARHIGIRKHGIGPWWLGLIAAALFCAPSLQRAHAQASTVWQIGTFDQSSHEFRSDDIRYDNPADDPIYVVGKSDPAHDWYAFQPGDSNGSAGHRRHPFTVEFDLPQQPSGLYSLRLSLLHANPRVPLLDVAINGHEGWFYQHLKASYNRGEIAVLKDPHYSQTEISFDVPSEFLARGRNKLVLTALDDPAERDDSENGVASAPGDSGILYDAIALQHDPDGTFAPGQVTVVAEPTIFYKMRAGQLCEVVDLFVRYGVRQGQHRVSLTVAGKEINGARETVAPQRDFGEQLVEFDVPEFSRPMPVTITVEAEKSSLRFARELIPAKKWNVFVVPQEHLDVGYTDYPAKVAAVQSRVLDEVIATIGREPDFRWTVDGYWPVEQFLAGRDADQRKAFVKLVDEKKIFVPAEYAPVLTGLPSIEGLLRSFVPSYEFHQRYGGAFDHAVITDVPSQTWAYASAMAAIGLKYYLAASNSGQGPMVVLGHGNERSPYWWQGPDGNKILVWVSRDYQQARRLFGMPPQLASVHDSLPIFLQMYSRKDYVSDGVIVFGVQQENTDLHMDQAAYVNAWNKVYAFPKLRFSGVAEAMEYIGRQMGDNIPTLRGSGGSYWEAFVASHPASVKLERQDERRALSAEKLSTIASLVNPPVQPDKELLKRLWSNIILYDEHTWNGPMIGAYGEPEMAADRALSKEVLPIENERLLDQVLLRGMADIADRIHVPASALVIFNPLSWARSGAVEMTLGRDFELEDMSTHRVVPYEVVSQGHEFRRIRFWAEDVPAVGYKSYALRTMTAQPVRANKMAETPVPVTMENAYYRVSLDAETGSVSSIFDKALRRELVESGSPYKFGQYLQVTGKSSRQSVMGLDSTIEPPPHFKICSASKGKIVAVTKTPLGSVAQLESTCGNDPPVETTVRLFDGARKIEFDEQVRQEGSQDSHFDYFAFPFAIKQPQFRFEIQNGVVDPAKDILPGGGLEAFAVQHWVEVREADLAAAIVPVDAPLVTLGDIDRYVWPTEFGQRPATVFSLAVRTKKDDSDGPSGQQEGGAVTFRYVLVSGQQLADAALSRIGWEEVSPFESDEVLPHDKVGNPERPLPPESYSFLKISRPGVVLVTWKMAEDGKGTILRLLEEAGIGGKTEITIPALDVAAAWKCDAVERSQQPLSVSQHGISLDVRSHEIVTIRVEAKPRLHQAAVANGAAATR